MPTYYTLMPAWARFVRAGTGVGDALALLDQATLAALTIDPTDGIIRAANETLGDALDIDPRRLKEKHVHEIVAEEHYTLADTILEALAHGAPMGPKRITLHPPTQPVPRGSIWAHLPAHYDQLVLLCQPCPVALHVPLRDPEDPEQHLGFGRIPPAPRWMAYPSLNVQEARTHRTLAA